MKDIFVKDLELDKVVNLKCWIANKRLIKDKLFLDIYDSTGTLECFASSSDTENFSELCKITKESCVCFRGKLVKSKRKVEFVIASFEVIAKSTLKISPYPNEAGFDVLDEKHSRQVITHPTFYIRNRKLSAIYYVKSVFKRQMQNYFWDRGFIEFEPPTFTRQTLYEDKGAIWLERDGQKLSLSRCATFHLEPALLSFERLFTITNSHADEKVKTNRHLIEYMHMKAEMAWFNLDELVEFAKNMYFETAKKTYEICRKELKFFFDDEQVKERLKKLNPKNHKLITYDEAVEIIKSKGIDFEYGKSLTTKQEMLITEHFGENFVWVKYIPYTVEGFMFKRKPDNDFFTMTCDLIAPNGFGEILGCAEKMTDYDEIISSMEQKGKMKDFERYKDYANLHKLGLPPHGGIGMGIERAVRYLLGINHVKYLKPFAIIKNSQVNH